VTVHDGTNSAVDPSTLQLNPSGVVVFTNLGPQSSTEDGVVTQLFLARDSSGGTQYFKASDLPSGLNVMSEQAWCSALEAQVPLLAASTPSECWHEQRQDDVFVDGKYCLYGHSGTLASDTRRLVCSMRLSRPTTTPC
jgi:hypothetical protein